MFSGTVPAKDAKQQIEFHCFLVPENKQSMAVFMHYIMMSAEALHYSSFK